MFEGGIRVPLMVKWPDKIAAGTAVDTPVAHIDIMPTLAEITGIKLPETAAEVSRLERDGCDVVGMTGMPESCQAWIWLKQRIESLS